MKVHELKTILATLDDGVEVYINNHHYDDSHIIKAEIIMCGNKKDKTERIALRLHESKT